MSWKAVTFTFSEIYYRIRMHYASKSRTNDNNHLEVSAQSSKHDKGGSSSNSRPDLPEWFTFVDLFAGIGGTRLPWDQLGGTCVFSSEIDPTAVEVYADNFGDTPAGDIRMISSKTIPVHDILCGGPPCQAFSKAGRMRGFDDVRGTLFHEGIRVVRDCRPKAAIFENVPNLLTHDSGRTWELLSCNLAEAGYSVSTAVLNAEDFELAQHRKRLIIVCFRNPDVAKVFHYPEPSANRRTFVDIAEEGPIPSHYYISPVALNGLVTRKAMHKEIGNGFGYNVVLGNETLRALVCGGSGRERNVIYNNKDLLSAVAGVGKNHPRWLTVRECARSQGFPEWFIPHAAKTHAYRHFGNAVPVPMIRAVGESVLKALRVVGEL